MIEALSFFPLLLTFLLFGVDGTSGDIFDPSRRETYGWTTMGKVWTIMIAGQRHGAMRCTAALLLFTLF